MTRKHRSKNKDDEALLLPWFLTRRATMAIRSNVPKHYQRRMRNYFDDYGCLRCGIRNGTHSGNGLCRRCSGTVLTRLKRSYERRVRPQRSHYAKDLLSKAHVAKALLKNLLHAKGPGSMRSRIKTSSSQNPALEVFSAYRIGASDLLQVSDPRIRNIPFTEFNEQPARVRSKAKGRDVSSEAHLHQEGS
jgi:ribosomal protein L40E